MSFKKCFCLLFIIIGSLTLTAQDSKTQKIGLCLSGGGAKGLAHIGLLKLIDSLGIKIDYITGTSMGGVVGGLYAAGYTGKQIDSIAHSVEWDLLLNQYVPMNDIYIDEKDEYGRYLGEIPIKKGKMEVTGFIEGQELLNTLMRLTKHVNQVIDFNKFPIPFKCMAVDIVKVEPVTMDHGSLAIAMRATMSIPTVFKPVKVDGRLLVDGGLMVNFPVKQLKEMGADIIIGSYTGGRLMAENEMNTFNKLLVQSSSFYGIGKSKDEIAICDIFNNLTDSMKQYSAGDFKKSIRIIEAGNVLSHNVLPQLIKLANKQKSSGIIYEKKNLVQSSDFFKVEDIIIEPTCDEKTSKFIMNRVTFKTGDSIDFKELERTITKIYGTRNFFKVYYLLEPQTNGNYIVKLKVEQDVKFRFKGALHYDSELGTGFILNVTARNWLGKQSRLTGTLDVAESPKYRIHYRKYRKQSNRSFNVDFFREKTTQKITALQGGAVIDEQTTLYRSFNMGINYNLAMPASFYLGIIGETSTIKPKYAFDYSGYLGGPAFDFKQSVSDIIGLLGRFKFNSLNSYIFPRKGTEILVENKFILAASDMGEATLITTDSFYNIVKLPFKDTSYYNPYNKLFIKINNLLPIGKRFSISSNLNMGLINTRVFKALDSTVNSKPASDYFNVGGVEQRPRLDYVPLWGFNDGELEADNFASIRVGIQYEALHKLFISPAVTYFYSSTSSLYFFKYFGKPNTNGTVYQPYTSIDEYGFEDIDRTKNFRAIITYGLNIGYKSPIGPINFNISKPSSDERWRAYISIGYRF